MPEQAPNSHTPSKIWWCIYNLKKGWHHLGRFFSGLASHKFFSIVLPWVTASYFAVLDFLGDEPWFKEHRPVVVGFFWICLLISLFTQFLQGIQSMRPKLESDKTAREIMSEFIRNVAVIVEAKLTRFRSKLAVVKPESDKFKHITLPEDQLKIIGTSASQFLRDSFGLREDELDITILRRKNDGDWNYIYQLQPWSHGSTKWLSERKSAAHQCAENREVVFFPDKIKSASEGLFLLSARDARRKLGSAYIYPASFEAASIKVDFVVSIITYGKQFAPEYDEASCEITKAFLREICRRFEVELCLDTIKNI